MDQRDTPHTDDGGRPEFAENRAHMSQSEDISVAHPPPRRPRPNRIATPTHRAIPPPPSTKQPTTPHANGQEQFPPPIVLVLQHNDERDNKEENHANVTQCTEQDGRTQTLTRFVERGVRHALTSSEAEKEVCKTLHRSEKSRVRENWVRKTHANMSYSNT